MRIMQAIKGWRQRRAVSALIAEIEQHQLDCQLRCCVAVCLEALSPQHPISEFNLKRKLRTMISEEFRRCGFGQISPFALEIRISPNLLVESGISIAVVYHGKVEPLACPGGPGIQDWDLPLRVDINQDGV